MKRTFLLAFALAACLSAGAPPPANADLIKQSTTWNRYVYMQDSTASRSPGVSGLTLTITASKNGAAFASISPTVTDLGNGWYSLALTTAHTNTLNMFAMRITAAGADETDTLDQIIAPDLSDATALGLTRLDAAVSTRGTSNYAGGDTSGTTTLLTRVPQTLLFNGSGFIKSDVEAYASLQDPATFVWGATATSYNVALTMGNKLNSAASAGDPWSTAVPGAYGAGTAGFKVGTYLDALISSRMASTTLPTNFGSLAIDSSGRVTVGAYATGMSPKEQTINLVIPGAGTLTYGQASYKTYLQGAGGFGAAVRSTSAPWTITVPFIRSSDGATVFTYTTTYTDSTFSKTLGRVPTDVVLPTP